MVRTALEYLLFKVDEIHLDILNAHLQFVTPFLRRNGVEYERDRFVEKLDAGTIAI
jgi:T-complex protein 11